MNRAKLSLRLPQRQLDFLKNYGPKPTEALEKALDRLKELEQNQEHLKTEQDTKRQQQLDFLREKERIKTEALERRQRLRPARAMRANVDWGGASGRGDPDGQYEQSYGDTF